MANIEDLNLIQFLDPIFQNFNKEESITFSFDGISCQTDPSNFELCVDKCNGKHPIFHFIFLLCGIFSSSVDRNFLILQQLQQRSALALFVLTTHPRYMGDHRDRSLHFSVGYFTSILFALRSLNANSVYLLMTSFYGFPTLTLTPS